MKNILTIDVEEWYHALFSQHQSIKAEEQPPARIKEVIDKVLDLLKRNTTTATFFILGEVAERFPEIVRRISDDQHEIAVHSQRHRIVAQISPEEFREDICQARDCIRDITSKTPCGFRAPAFSLRRDMRWAFKILSEEGFKYDSSIFPTKNLLYGDPGAPRFPFWLRGDNWKIKEFPPSVLKIGKISIPVAGGFYLRGLPLKLITHSIKVINKLGFSFVLYFHPWELDLGQPRPKGLTFRENFTHYLNRSSMLPKLEYLLNNFEFTSVANLENLK